MVLKDSIEDSMDNVSNEEMMTRAAAKKKLLCEIRVKQLRFFGYMMRKKDLETLAMTGKIKGKEM